MNVNVIVIFTFWFCLFIEWVVQIGWEREKEEKEGYAVMLLQNAKVQSEDCYENG